MKILIDTNVILDVLWKRQSFYEHSINVFRTCEIELFDGYISALDVADIIYIMRKQLNAEDIEKTIVLLKNAFHIVDLTDDILMSAALRRDKDFEDAVQIETAREVGASYIITNNLKHFTNSDIPCIPPKDIYKLLD